MRIVHAPRLARILGCGALLVVLGLATAVAHARWPRSLHIPAQAILAGAPRVALPDELPAWFGDGRAPRRIAGATYVDDRPAPLTVHLRLPDRDRGTWRGRDVLSGPDGRFDFGLLPRGEYQLWAGDDDHMSRIAQIDTRARFARLTDLFAYRCRPFDGVVTADGVPVIGAPIEIAGAEVARSGVDGRFRGCAGVELDADVGVHVAGYRSYRWPIDAGDHIAVELDHDIPDARPMRGGHGRFPDFRPWRLRGRVIYRGRPVPAARVEYRLSRQADFMIFTVHTDRDGNFDIAVLSGPGIDCVRVEHTARGLWQTRCVHTTSAITDGVEIALEPR